MVTTTELETLDKAICAQCREYLGNDASELISHSSCSVCLDLWGAEATVGLVHAIQEACKPYGGVRGNRFSRDQSPTVALPGEIALRYHLASHGQRAAAQPTVYIRELKEHLKNAILRRLEKDEHKTTGEYPCFVDTEEQGYLSIHVMITAEGAARPGSFLPARSNKRVRKRFRGNDPTEKQGGDPRTNLQNRVQNEVKDFWSVTDMQGVLDQEVSPERTRDWLEWYGSSSDGAVSTQSPVSYHVAVWRRPFFVHGLYTKSRRDVSQTPFYVPTEANTSVMKRMGVSSVEEQIAPVLSKLACGGISVLNNDPSATDVVYGMVKFHASGREDMNVRMLLPPGTATGAGGRPFVCQVVDALRMPTIDNLQSVQRAINHTSDDCRPAAVSDEDLSGRVYGRNPKGVGIDRCSLAPASSFKNLQAETEEKVKYYGCLCWNQDAITSQEELSSRLGGSFCPIELQQRTPIRVLHRRSNAARIRHVLSLEATRIDNHYFRLNLSTDAGTYVKEFVHGDLGRTAPSVSSLLGCKTDILELDCEGIQGV